MASMSKHDTISCHLLMHQKVKIMIVFTKARILL